MGLKRRNPARTRLFTAPEVLATLAFSAAPVANAPAKVTPVEAAAVEAAAPATPATPAAPARAPTPAPISGEQRHQMIARAAYRHAERAGFAVDPLQSWLTAERDVDAQLARLAG